MYGGGGASGGGAGSTTGAPMGATGAAGAGSAADPNAQLQALMSLRQVRMSERKNEAEINLLNTQADALKAEAGKTKEETTVNNRKKAMGSKARDVQRMERLH